MPKNKGPISSFTIPLRRWLRGKEAAKTGSYLFHSQTRKMCCLGIYLKACGLPVSAIIGRHNPGAISSVDVDAVPGWLLNANRIGNSKICGSLMCVNDFPKTADRDRRVEIKKLFAKHSIKVTFK